MSCFANAKPALYAPAAVLELRCSITWHRESITGDASRVCCSTFSSFTATTRDQSRSCFWDAGFDSDNVLIDCIFSIPLLGYDRVLPGCRQWYAKTSRKRTPAR